MEKIPITKTIDRLAICSYDFNPIEHVRVIFGQCVKVRPIPILATLDISNALLKAEQNYTKFFDKLTVENTCSTNIAFQPNNF